MDDSTQQHAEDIEVTSSMTRAGAETFWRLEGAMGSEQMVEEIFRAMVRARGALMLDEIECLRNALRPFAEPHKMGDAYVQFHPRLIEAARAALKPRQARYGQLSKLVAGTT